VILLTRGAFMLCLATATIASGPAAADTVQTGANDVRFDFELKDDSGARTCNLETLVLVPPEAINFRLIFGFPKSRETSFYAFSIDAGNMRFRNGRPEGLDPVKVTAADVSAAHFNSAETCNSHPAR
jgi:hypothetical protein